MDWPIIFAAALIGGALGGYLGAKFGSGNKEGSQSDTGGDNQPPSPSNPE